MVSPNWWENDGLFPSFNFYGFFMVFSNMEPRTSTQCRQHGIVTDHAGLHRSLGVRQAGTRMVSPLEETLVTPKRDQK